jgi:ribosomal protein L18
VTAASTKEKEFKSAGMSSRGRRAAEWVGKSVAERIKKVGLEAVVLDRGPNLYHAGGCLDILVSAVRSAGVRV